MKCWAVYFNQPVPYARGTALQEALLAARIAGQVPDTVLFLEHTPVITLGRRGRDQHLLLDSGELQKRGIELAQASRGGDVTYHGPGQLVMYPILKLGERETGSHDYLSNLEQTAIDTAAHFGVAAFRKTGMAGAWTADGKIAAIGFKLKRWVSYHGMSFNVNLDPGMFEVIVPCGLADVEMTSVARELGAGPLGLDARVRKVVGDAFTRAYA